MDSKRCSAIGHEWMRDHAIELLLNRHYAYDTVACFLVTLLGPDYENFTREY